MREEVFFKNFSHSLRKRFFIAMKFKFVASMVQKTFCVDSLMQFLFGFAACKDQKLAGGIPYSDPSCKKYGRAGVAAPTDARGTVCPLN
jgi:hypothetical protein